MPKSHDAYTHTHQPNRGWRVAARPPTVGWCVGALLLLRHHHHDGKGPLLAAAFSSVFVTTSTSTTTPPEESLKAVLSFLLGWSKDEVMVVVY